MTAEVPGRVKVPRLRLHLMFLAFALAGLLAGGEGELRAAQSVGGVRVIDQMTPAGLQLSIVNSNLAAVTLTVHLTLQNATVDPPQPMVVSCIGRGVFPFATLKPQRDSGSFKYRARFLWQFGQANVQPATNVAYELPFASGSKFTVAQGFRGNFTHTGNNEFAVDFSMPVGTRIHAAREGTVEVVVDRFSQGGEDPRFREQANLILVRHSDGTYGEYIHLRHRGAQVRPGQRIAAREFLGYSGNTGYSRGPHLHFAVFRTVDGTRRETLPIRFRTGSGATELPVTGRTYAAP